MNNNSNGNDANASTENQREAEDRLVDWGLRKNGATKGEAAPDLTEQIMAASAAQVVRPERSLDVAESTAGSKNTNRRLWLIALAALLLAGFASLFATGRLPVAWSPQSVESAHDVNGVTWEDAAQLVKELGNGTGPMEAKSHGDAVSHLDTTDEGAQQGFIWADVTLYPDGGGGARLDAVEHDISQLAAEGQATDNDKLMMMTTPRIVIQDEEESLDLDDALPRAIQQGYDMNSGYRGYQGEGGGGGRATILSGVNRPAMPQGRAEGDGIEGGYTFDLSLDSLADSIAIDAALESDREYYEKKRSAGEYQRQLSNYLSIQRGNASSKDIQQLQNEVASLKQAIESRKRVLMSRIDHKLTRSPERQGNDRYAPIHENAFIAAKGTAAVSTFSIDVDTASYTNMRQYLNNGQLPPPNSVRLEELVNYFKYDYAGPDQDDKHPFAAHTEVATCPWNESHRLVRVALKGREIETDKRPLSNIVFLVDVSGSMNDSNKLPLVIDGLKQMTAELGENDRVAIVVYAGSEGLALDSTCGEEKDQILAALGSLSAGGSTAGGAGIELAYKVAEKHFIKGGSNRVILCTDGDFNVGVSDTASLERLAEAKAAETGVFLTVLGCGQGNLNDEMMEKISNCGNGNYYYIDNLREARRVLVRELSGTLVTIAKDVKIQVEFNPANVAGYRLLGYENRMLARKDFDDDTKDAGEVGAGHTVTALYEVVPVGSEKAKKPAKPQPEPLKYQPAKTVEAKVEPVAEEDSVAAGEGLAEFTDELLTLRLRYKLPDEDVSTKIEVAVKDDAAEFAKASGDFRFASSVAGFGMLLRGSRYRGDATFASVRDLAAESLGKDEDGRRTEFLELIDAARGLVE